jgi:hypothetical protein
MLLLPDQGSSVPTKHKAARTATSADTAARDGPDGVDLPGQAVQQGRLVPPADVEPLDTWVEQAAGAAYLQRAVVGLGVHDPDAGGGHDQVVDVGP